MKAQCASLTLYHFAEGHHRDVCIWHDQDHKPEVVGTVPGIFISQRWVAPPENLALFPPSRLEHAGGEYVNLYWTTTSPDELGADFASLGERLEAVGRMQPMRYIQRTWGDRLRPVAAIARPELGLSAEAVACAPQTTGLLVTIDAFVPEESADAFENLETGIFTAGVRLVSAAYDVYLWYTDREDVLDAYREFRARAPRADGKRLHEGIYVPSIGHHEFYA